jgi:ABC-2 type transport system ATP-binding protein
MDLGRLLALDTPQALMRSLQGEATLELATDRSADGAVVDALAALDGVERVERLLQSAAEGAGPPNQVEPAASSALRVRLYLTGEAALLVAPAAAALAEHGLSLVDVKLGTPTLEDVFINLTGRTLR